MKKFSKIGKRVLAFFLVALMNINTYAAVGGNDGSAFVTKAEFDALVNTFNEQMDTYEDSIVTKIDGAIANYLAGISRYQVITQTSIINKISMPFINGWNLEWPDGGKSCNLGDKFNYCMFALASRALDGYYYNRRVNPSVSGRNSWEWKFGTDDIYVPLYRSQGSTNSRYVIYSDSMWDSRFKTLALLLQSQVNSNCILLDVSAWDGIPDVSWSSTNKGGMNDKSIFKDNSDTFRTLDVNRTYKTLGFSGTMRGVAGFSNDDTFSPASVASFVSGSTVPTDIVYAVKNTELNKKSTEVNLEGHATQGYYKALYDDDSTSVATRDDAMAYEYKIAGYHHKYTTIPSGTGMTDFIVDSVSYILDLPVHYYSGLPIFTATEGGTARVELKFVNNEDRNSTFEIRGSSFGNDNITAGVSTLTDATFYYIDDEGNTIRNVTSIPSGKVLNVEFLAEKGITYWIKVMPTKVNTYTTITSENITITTE